MSRAGIISAGIILICIIMFAVTGCARQAEVFDPSSGATVTAWDRLIQQPTEGKEADALLAEYAALPQPTESLQTAQIWALAVQRRNGYAQFALLSERQKKRQRIRYEAAGWVSGVSSPWVESFDIAGKKDDIKVAFALNTSTGIYGSFTVKLGMEEKDGVCRIAGIEWLEGDAQAYILNKLE